MSVATETFGMQRPELNVDWYNFVVCAPTPTITMRDGLFTLCCPGNLKLASAADTLIVPNRPDPEAPVPKPVLKAIQLAYKRGARIISFCTGTFTLAEAGILSKHTVTTHWRWTKTFGERYPHVRLKPDVLFVDDGQVLSAAGSAAALDLCLAVIRTDYGIDVMRSVSRRLVFAAHREGGQQQFLPTAIHPRIPSMLGGGSADLSAMETWAASNLREPITVADLAARANTSVSTLHRLAPHALGSTPLQWLQRRRVDEARRLLEISDMSIESVAEATGLGSATNLRTHFHRSTGLTPSAYRLQFR
jgi:AraC family transcriptional regulator, transcriptional activator FtrA